MRRKDKEIREQGELEEILRRGRVCVLGLVDGGMPYTVPVSYGYSGGCLYIHSAREGRKLDMLRREGRVSFCVYIDEELVKGENACNWGMKYRSVAGTGRAELVENRDEKEEALAILMRHFGGPAGPYEAGKLDKVLVIRVRIEEMTGKRSGYLA